MIFESVTPTNLKYQLFINDAYALNAVALIPPTTQFLILLLISFAKTAESISSENVY